MESILPVTIDRLSYGPAGVGRVNGKVWFVAGTVPGDDVVVALDEEKPTYAIGRLIEVRRPSPWRREPPCPYVGRCGGCPWQQVGYLEQLRAKDSLVREHLRRIGGFPDPPVAAIIPCPQEWHFRHRIRLRTGPSATLGFYHAGSHELIEIAHCRIAGRHSDGHLRVAREWLATLKTVVRRLEMIGCDPDLDDAADVVLVGNAEGSFQPDDEEVCSRLVRTRPDVTGLVLFGRRWRRTWGDTTVKVALGLDGLTLAVTNGGFTQSNPVANRALIEALLRLGEFRPNQHVLELHCGSGNLSFPMARRVKALTGIERDRAAVTDARANATRLGVRNARFETASAVRGVRGMLRRGKKFDTVVLDPPRAGAAELMDELAKLRSPRVIYVSCNPTTLARDLRRLASHGYRLAAVQPVDLFPHTFHVETIAVSVLTC